MYEFKFLDESTDVEDYHPIRNRPIAELCREVTARLEEKFSLMMRGYSFGKHESFTEIISRTIESALRDDCIKTGHIRPAHEADLIFGLVCAIRDIDDPDAILLDASEPASLDLVRGGLRFPVRQIYFSEFNTYIHFGRQASLSLAGREKFIEGLYVIPAEFDDETGQTIEWIMYFVTSCGQKAGGLDQMIANLEVFCLSIHTKDAIKDETLQTLCMRHVAAMRALQKGYSGDMETALLNAIGLVGHILSERSGA